MKRRERYKLMRVTTEYYCAGALWVQRSGVWAATTTAPILNWMRFKSAGEVHLELLRLGARWEWTESGGQMKLAAAEGLPGNGEAQ